MSTTNAQFDQISEDLIKANELLMGDKLPEFCAFYRTVRAQLLDVYTVYRTHDHYLQRMVQSIQRHSKNTDTCVEPLFAENSLLGIGSKIYSLNIDLVRLLLIAGNSLDGFPDIIELMLHPKKEWQDVRDAMSAYAPDWLTTVLQTNSYIDSTLQKMLSEAKVSEADKEDCLIFTEVDAKTDVIKPHIIQVLKSNYAIVSSGLNSLADTLPLEVSALPSIIAIKMTTNAHSKTIQVFGLDCLPSDIPTLMGSLMMYDAIHDCFECELPDLDFSNAIDPKAAARQTPHVALFMMLALNAGYLYVIDTNTLYKNTSCDLA